MMGALSGCKLTCFLLVLLISGNSILAECTLEGTLFYNITGNLPMSDGQPQDYADPENTKHRTLSENLTNVFDWVFNNEECVIGTLVCNITIVHTFVWPNVSDVDNVEGEFNLSFVVFVQTDYRANPSDMVNSYFIINKFWFVMLDSAEGDFYTVKGLRFNEANIEQIEDNDWNATIGVMNNYMGHITKLFSEETGKPSNNSSQEKMITTVSYVGISCSMVGLSLTLVSIGYFKRLRKFRGNQILAHICVTIMLGMLLTVASYLQDHRERLLCKAIPICLHYFILSALCWMCVEAHNLYRDLVKVFNTNNLSTAAFFLRACLFSYGTPALIVGVVLLVDDDIYGPKNETCWMTSLPFLVSFLSPVLLIVFINGVFFVFIMREIVQVSQQDARTLRPSLRAAISLSVLLGFCWISAAASTFSRHVFFQYAFVVMSSFQGFFIFLFHGIGKKELRDSWRSLGFFKWTFAKTSSNSASHGRGGKTESTLDALQTPVGTARTPKCARGTLTMLAADNVVFDNTTKRGSCDTLLGRDELAKPRKDGADQEENGSEPALKAPVITNVSI